MLPRRRGGTDATTTARPGARGLRAGARVHGDERLLRRARRRRVDRDDPPRPRARHRLPRHRRHVRAVHERAARRRGDRGAPRRGRARDQVRQRARARTARFVGVNGRPEYVRRACDASLAAPRRRHDRPLLPAPRRPRPSPSRRPSAPWPRSSTAGKVRHLGISEAVAGDDPPRPRRAPAHRGAVRVLAVDARPRGRGARRRAASSASASSPTARSDAASSPARSAAAATSTSTTPAGATRGSGRRTRRRNRALVDVVREVAARAGRDRRAGRARLGALAGDDLVPIPGTKRARTSRRTRRRTTSCCPSDALERLDEAFAPGAASGERYPERAMQSLNG